MRTQIKDGGPAFPHTGMSQQGGQAFQAVFAFGMSLRDWFAGQALAGTACMAEPGVRYASDLARECYEMADAMIAAREAKQ